MNLELQDIESRQTELFARQTIMHPIPVYCRIWFAPILIGMWAGVGYLWFHVMNAMEPFDELDFWYYLVLYCGIEAMIGFAAWYFVRLVAMQHISATAVLFVMFPVYLFVTALALDKNPIIAMVATLSFAFIAMMVFLADRSVRLRSST